MAGSDSLSEQCSGARRQTVQDCDPSLIVDLLSDSIGREIYECAETPKTVQEITAEIDIPLSTAYRKIEKLEEAGLLYDLAKDSYTDVPAQYVRNIDRVSITCGDCVRIDCRINGRRAYCTPDLTT